MALAGTPRQALALALSLVLPLTLAGPDVLAAGVDSVTSVEGRLLLADGQTPWSGAVLQVSPVEADTVYESVATDAKGRFLISDFPSGDYVFSVRDGEGVYRLGPGVRLAPGKHEDVVLGLAPAAADDAEAEDDEEDDDDDKALGMLKNPLSMTLLALSGLTLILWGIDELDDNDPVPSDKSASPSSP